MTGSTFIFFTFLGVATSRARGQRLAAVLVLVSPWVEPLDQEAVMNLQGKFMPYRIKKK